MTFLASLVIELEHAVQLHIVVRIAETAVAVAVPQDSITGIAKHERNTHLGVILEQVLVLSAHVQFLCLVLSEAVELLRLVLELQRPREAVALFVGDSAYAYLSLWHLERGECLAVLCLLCQALAISIKERYLACFLIHLGCYILCLHLHDVTLF